MVGFFGKLEMVRVDYAMKNAEETMQTSDWQRIVK